MRRKSQEKKDKTTIAVALPKKREEITKNLPADQVGKLPVKIQKEAHVDEYNLPAVYNNTKVTLIPRDPYWIHAYWEIAPQALDALKNKFGAEIDGAAYTLRMYDVSCINFDGNNAHHWFDIDFSPPANNWYVSLWRDNMSYCAEIGLRTSAGKFHVLARSNFVTTPPVSSSARSDVIWMKVEDTSQQPPFIFREIKRQQVKAWTHPAAPAPKQRKKISLTEDDIRAYYAKLFPLLRRVRGNHEHEKGKEEGVFKRQENHPLWTEADPLYADNTVLTLSKDEIKKLLLGSSGSLMSGASEKNAVTKQRKFYFEIGTELIVYGRTEPDAAVWLGDKKIELRADGTFTLRFALADNSEIPLDFVAVSGDKMSKREIKTAGKRTKTVYCNQDT